MNIEATTRITVTDALGRLITSVELAARKDVGDNARFFITESVRLVQKLADDTVYSAASAVDRKRAGEKD